jgi:hypothetical protein
MNEDRPPNNGDKLNGFALVRKPSNTVEKAAPGAKRILSGMVVDALALVKAESPAIDDAELENWFQTGEKYRYPAYFTRFLWVS